MSKKNGVLESSDRDSFSCLFVQGCVYIFNDEVSFDQPKKYISFQ